VSGGLKAQLRVPLLQPADLSEVLADGWTSLSAREISERPVYLQRDGRVPLGELFDIRGEPEGRIRFVGNLEHADRLGAGLKEGDVVVEGSVGSETGMGMAGGSLDVSGNAGPRTGAAQPGFKRGMTGGELIVRGSAGPETGAGMRRGLVVIVKSCGDRTGLGMIAGSVVVFGAAGQDTGLWSKRGSIIALGPVTPPATYAYACTYRPVHLPLMFKRLQTRYDLSIHRRHLTGFYHRYSGDLAELGKGEILQWTAK